MKYENLSMFIPSVGKSLEAFDALAFFDAESNRIIVIDSKAFAESNFESATVITKTAELAAFGSIKLVNPEAFTKRFPSSQFESYIIAGHSAKVCEDFDFYLASYIILYRYYKSLETLVEHNLIGLIDSFIDNCVSENTDHLCTLCYSKNEIHKVLKLRKAVFEMFRKYFTSYSNYKFIFTNQHYRKYTDKDFRAFRKKLIKLEKANQRAREAASSSAPEGGDEAAA